MAHCLDFELAHTVTLMNNYCCLQTMVRGILGKSGLNQLLQDLTQTKVDAITHIKNVTGSSERRAGQRGGGVFRS